MERKKVTKDLGKLAGPLLVFGGVYSNLQALLKLRSIADDLQIPAHQVICTGDVVAYCAQPEECVQTLLDWNIETIAGNVEIQLREGQDDCGCDFREGGRCDTFSRQWYPFAQSKLSEASINWMKRLPDFIRFSYAGLAGLVVHGSYFDTADYIFASTAWAEKMRNFQASESELILAGHAGLPFHQQQAEKYWINAGVIGMPANDATPRVWYALLQTSPQGHLTFSHHSFTYEHQETASLMQLHQLPATYAQTLQTGIWDNNEILPAAETAQAGKPLQLDFPLP